MMAKSVGGATRGFHPDVVVCDDILLGTTATDLAQTADWLAWITKHLTQALELHLETLELQEDKVSLTEMLMEVDGSLEEQIEVLLGIILVEVQG